MRGVGESITYATTTGAYACKQKDTLCTELKGYSSVARPSMPFISAFNLHQINSH